MQCTNRITFAFAKDRDWWIGSLGLRPKGRKGVTQFDQPRCEFLTKFRIIYDKMDKPMLEQDRLETSGISELSSTKTNL